MDNPEFKELLLYVHHLAPIIKIPGHHAIRRQAMKMGEDGIEATKKMFWYALNPYSNFCECMGAYLNFSNWIVRLAFHLMHGCRAICMLLWPLLPIM